MLVASALALGALGLTWGGLKVSLSHAAEACYATRQGYLQQQVVEVHRRWWTVECVMDPRDGSRRYTVHRPWQSVRAIRDIDGD